MSDSKVHPLDGTGPLGSRWTVLAAAWSPDVRYLAAGEQPATLYLWALPSMTIQRRS